MCALWTSDMNGPATGTAIVIALFLAVFGFLVGHSKLYHWGQEFINGKYNNISNIRMRSHCSNASEWDSEPSNEMIAAQAQILNEQALGGLYQ